MSGHVTVNGEKITLFECEENRGRLLPIEKIFRIVKEEDARSNKFAKLGASAAQLALKEGKNSDEEELEEMMYDYENNFSWVKYANQNKLYNYDSEFRDVDKNHDKNKMLDILHDKDKFFELFPDKMMKRAKTKMGRLHELWLNDYG